MQFQIFESQKLNISDIPLSRKSRNDYVSQNTPYAIPYPNTSKLFPKQFITENRYIFGTFVRILILCNIKVFVLNLNIGFYSF